MAPADPYEPFRKIVRAEGKVATPWRLGYAVGFAGEALPPPYDDAKSAKNYRVGYRDGEHGRRIKRQEPAPGAALDTEEKLDNWNNNFGLGQGGAD